MKTTVGMLAVLLGVLLGVLVGVAQVQRVSASAVTNTGILHKDANNVTMQLAPAAALVDNLALAATVSNLALTSNVVTLTTGTHGYTVGQKVTVALLTGPTLFADCNGTFAIATVPSSTTVTYALTHANILTGAATGSTTAYNLSPVATGTTETTFKFPAKSFALILIPTDATDSTYSYTSGGGLGGTFPLFQNTANVIAGVEGDLVYVQRTTTTKLAFQFATCR